MNINRSNLIKIGFTESGTFQLSKSIGCDNYLSLEFDFTNKEMRLICEVNEETDSEGEVLCENSYCEMPIYIDTIKELKTLIKFLEGYKIKESKNTTRYFNMTENQYKKKYEHSKNW